MQIVHKITINHHRSIMVKPKICSKIHYGTLLRVNFAKIKTKTVSTYQIQPLMLFELSHQSDIGRVCEIGMPKS